MPVEDLCPVLCEDGLPCYRERGHTGAHISSHFAALELDRLTRALLDIAEGKVPDDLIDENNHGDCGSYHAENGATYVHDQIRIALGRGQHHIVVGRRPGEGYGPSTIATCKNCGAVFDYHEDDDYGICPTPKPQSA